MPELTGQLCICVTPLHVLISRRIAELRGAPFSSGVFITSSDNEKQRHYAEVMRGFCTTVEYIVLPGEGNVTGPKHLALWKYRRQYRLAFRRFGPVKTVYVSSSNDPHIYILLSAVRFSELVTFDDGLLNVNRNSPLFTSPTRARAMVFLRMAGVCYWPERIRAESAMHYSIYSGENICERVQRIDLVERNMNEVGQAGEESRVKILLGSAPEAEQGIWNTLQAAASQLRPNGYLPHPREKQPKISGVEYLETSLVVEDYVLTQLRSDPLIRFEIYGYDSAALVNLARAHRVRAYSLLPDTIQTQSTRELMQSNGVSMWDSASSVRAEPVVS